jgi:hypothetical protein
MWYDSYHEFSCKADCAAAVAIICSVYMMQILRWLQQMMPAHKPVTTGCLACHALVTIPTYQIAVCCLLPLLWPVVCAREPAQSG